MADISPIDRAEELLDGGASTLSAARTLAGELGVHPTAARVHVLRAQERQQRERVQVRSAGAEGILKRLAEITDTALSRQGVTKDGDPYDDPDARAAVDAQKTIARILGLDQEDADLRRAKARLTAARASAEETKARRAGEQLSLDLRHREARADLAEVEARRAKRAAGEDGGDPAEGYEDPLLDAPGLDTETARGGGDDPGSQ